MSPSSSAKSTGRRPGRVPEERTTKEKWLPRPRSASSSATAQRGNREHSRGRTDGPGRSCCAPARRKSAPSGGSTPLCHLGVSQCARRTVLAPTWVFKGLKRGEGGLSKVNNGWAFCGKPRKAYRNDGTPFPAPEGMVHMVYADEEGYVFDWDWVRENPMSRLSPGLATAIRLADPTRTGCVPRSAEDVTARPVRRDQGLLFQSWRLHLLLHDR